MKIKGHINAGIKEEWVEYTCIKCGKTPLPLVFRPNITEGTKKLYMDAIEEQLCLCCLTGTDARIEGAAENLEGLLCH